MSRQVRICQWPDCVRARLETEDVAARRWADRIGPTWSIWRCSRVSTTRWSPCSRSCWTRRWSWTFERARWWARAMWEDLGRRTSRDLWCRTRRNGSRSRSIRRSTLEFRLSSTSKERKTLENWIESKELSTTQLLLFFVFLLLFLFVT